jgi:transketolase
LRTTFIETLIDLAEKDERIFLLTPDMGYSVLEPFREKFPSRFLNTGIAEQNTIGVAAGLAKSGKIVYVYSIIPFVTMRCFEQVRLDLAYNNTQVRLVGIGAGMTYGPLGPTHHAYEDIAIMRAIPNMKIICPGDPIETKELVCQTYDMDGPLYIRLAKNGEPNIHKNSSDIKFGKAVELNNGNDLILVTTSNMLETGNIWVEEWKKEGVNVTLVSMHTIKPLDQKFIEKLISRKLPIITLEEHNVIGGLGSAVAEIIAESGCTIPFKRIGINDEFSHYVGNHTFQRKKFNLIKKPNLDTLFKKSIL